MSDALHHKPDISKANVCPALPHNASSFDKAIYWLGIGLGSGLPQKAPGTWGTLGGMVVAVPMMMFGFIPFVVITIIASIIGIWICDHTSKLMNVHDDPHIVFDEWVGIWISMLPMVYFLDYVEFGCVANPDGFLQVKQQALIGMTLAIFALFRFFDIIKPFPIGYLDKKLSGGFGIMIDDILAGFAVLAVLALSLFVFLLFK